MSRARPVFAGAVVFTTRRVHKRQLLLRPSPRVNQLIEYVVAVCARRHGVELHAVCAMSNHIHTVSTDREGRAVEFERDCHAIIARALNAMHGDFESVWSREPSCRVACVEPSDTLEKIAYTLANPVAAGLVADGKSWPGLRLAWPMKPRTVRRPPGFFRDEDHGGRWPEEVTLELHRPAGFAQLSDQQLAALLDAQVQELEAAARGAVRAAGRQFLGRRGIRRQSRYSYPSSAEPRFGIRPQVAARSKWARIERLQQNRDWLEEYKAARDSLRTQAGVVLFPHGTWKMRVYFRFACAPPPTQRIAA